MPKATGPDSRIYWNSAVAAATDSANEPHCPGEGSWFPLFFFSISASLMRIFRALILSQAVLALVFLHSAPVLGKWYYVGDRNVAGTFLGGDGSAAAPSGAPQYAGLLDAYPVRPSWQVAGVDYAVGVHPDVVLKVPTAGNLPPGATLGNHVINITGNNVTLSGYDLTGYTVMIQDSARGTVTIANSRRDVRCQHQEHGRGDG